MDELLNIINNLDDKIELINQNVQFNINMIISILSLSIAIAGIALYQLAKKWVYQSVQSELKEIKEELNNLKNENIELNKKLSKVVLGSGYGANGYIHFGDGTHINHMKCKVSIKGSGIINYTFPVSFDDLTEVIPTVSVIGNKNIKAYVDNVNISGISIYFEKCSDNEIEEAEISIIAIGKFNKGLI